MPTTHPSRSFARSRQWPRIDTLRGGEIASAMGMDFEQALRVRQLSGVAEDCDRPGAFLPCLRQDLHGVDGRAQKDKGLP